MKTFTANSEAEWIELFSEIINYNDYHDINFFH